jgi:uncharacterized protein YyaL (SSP411 family)
MNRLARETSPYLLQHAANPVDWYPWGPEALARARREDKPILLSIGYSACHWCHVMAHESFEDPATAHLMNDLYVNIKVDREERPDLDRIYQAAHHLLMRRGGGWPLTMFLTPAEQVPFFAGTYFPGEARHGMPAFRDVLVRAAEFYARHPPEIDRQGPALREALASIEASTPVNRPQLDRTPLQRFRDIMAEQFDEEFGGFGGAPKFPHAGSIELLLRLWRRTARDPEPDLHALYMGALSLQRMIEGGIHDQLGGGFCRYAVDRHWSIPHFEKMLYDNAALLTCCCQLFQVGGDEVFRRAAEGIADWVLRDMRAPAGGFFSSLDADSEGEEGRFYVWTPAEVRTLVSAGEYAVLAPHYGLDQPANFEEHWHLRVYRPLEVLAGECNQPVSTLRRELDSGRAKLLAARTERPWPQRDEKILTSWNALMIRALALGARVLRRDDLAHAAAAALDFLRLQALRDGRLQASWKDGEARFNAYLDDHAFLLDATLELLQIRWDAAHLHLAVWLAEELLGRFADDEQGGFFFTAHDHEPLLHRSRSMADEALPAGNAVAALALGRLGHLLGEPRYLAAAEQVVCAAWEHLSAHPHAHATLLMALDEVLDPPEIVVIRAAGCTLGDWATVAQAAYAPRRLVFPIPADAGDLPGALAARATTDGPVAYICHAGACAPAVRSIEALAAALAAA